MRMERKQAVEDFTKEGSKCSKDEEMWLKKTKNKFKPFEIVGNEVEGEEKIRKITKGKNKETTTEEDKEMKNKINNDKFEGEIKDLRWGKDGKEGKEAWRENGEKNENPFKKGAGENNNNNNNNKEDEGKKKYVAGKVRIIEGMEGPIPKMIELNGEGKKKVEIKRKKGGKGKKKLRKPKVFGDKMGQTSTQLEEETATEGNQDGTMMGGGDEMTQDDEVEENGEGEDEEDRIQDNEEEEE